MADIILSAEKRQKLGGSTALQLRNEGRVPGVVYGHGEPSIPFHVKALDLRPLIYTQETHTVQLQLAGEAQPIRCILREVQFHPVTDRISHVDFIMLHAGEKIRIDVPVMLHGTPIGVRDGGVMDFTLHKLTIQVLPDAIPQHIDVDVTGLKIGQSIHVSDLPAHPGYTIDLDEHAVIVSIAAPKTGDDTASTADATPAEPEQIKAKGKKEEEA